jgi:hypothetical protein
MRATWFFATTPAPRVAIPERRAPLSTTLQHLWHRAGERMVAWGVGARHHRMGSVDALRSGGEYSRPRSR